MIAHPCPGTWSWWASNGDGESFTIGPCATREIAIDQAYVSGGGGYTDADGNWRASFLVAECRENHVDLARWFDVERFLEDAWDQMDDNDCGANEDGDRHPLEEIDSKAQADLQACIRSTIRHWQDRKGLKLRSYWFAEIRHAEQIDQPVPGPS
ncbi:MAG: hypothetical protein ACI9BH_003016 [Paracoccaceae bacterium]|jgi:hypothetical protein